MEQSFDIRGGNGMHFIVIRDNEVMMDGQYNELLTNFYLVLQGDAELDKSPEQD